jgi:hypothetical protein
MAFGIDDVDIIWNTDMLLQTFKHEMRSGFCWNVQEQPF